MERELWGILYRLARILDKPWGRWKYAVSDVVGAYFWAVLYDRPTHWAAARQNWPADLLPAWLPSQSTLSRRLRQPPTVDLMTTVEEHLVALLNVGRCLTRMIDGKALAVSLVSKDPDTGFGRGAGGSQKGYKLHAIWDVGPMPIAWGLAPMNVSEKTVASYLIPTLPGGGYLVADSQYDANPVYESAAHAGFQLVAQKIKDRGRGGLGHRRQSDGRLRCLNLLSTEFGQALMSHRNTIEGRFGAWVATGGGLGPLPAWVRRFNRVRNWVQAKIIATGIRWLCLHRRDKLALA